MPGAVPNTVAQPLLRTKTSIPPIRPELVRRHRLIERLNRGARGALTVLSAPAGFGKTNLLTQWADAASVPVAWLTVDQADNDITRFFGYLVSALQTRELGIGEEARDFVTVTRGTGLEAALTLLINDIGALPRELALVIDDFQCLEEPTVLHCIGYLLRHLPTNLHLLIASRGKPCLDLALPRASGRVTDLDENDLRFTDDEVTHFVRRTMGIVLPAETVQALVKRTEGWAAALHLAAISVRGQPDPAALLASLHGDARYLADYLAEEVLDRQPEDTRQFLLRSSVLHVLTGPLCEAVVNPKAKPGYGSVMLNRLEHANLFTVALDAEREWFRYHPLFGDFLRHVEADINPTELPVLHKRAAVWFEAQGSLEDACRHAHASGDLEWMADLIERSVHTMVTRGDVPALTRWIEALPENTIHQRPRLALAYAWGAAAAYRLDLARHWLDDAERSIDPAGGAPAAAAPCGSEAAGSLGDVGLWNVSGGLAICRSTLALLAGDMKQAAEFSRQATSHLHKENPFVRSLLALDDSWYLFLAGDTQEAIGSLRGTVAIARQASNVLVMIIAMCQLAEMQALQGQLGQALVTLQKAQYAAVGPEGRPLPLAGLVDVGTGTILLERGCLTEARDYLERGNQTSRSLWPVTSLSAVVSLARLRQACGDIAGAQATLAEASELALSTESSQWDDTVTSAVGVRLALQRGDLAAAEQWWRRGAFPDLSGAFALENYPYHVYEYLQLTQARFLLLRGQDTTDQRDLRQAGQLLEVLRRDAERLRRATSLIEALVLQAMLESVMADSRAEDTLLDALALGEPEGYRQVYLDEGSALFDLLLCCRSAQRAPGRYLPSRGFIDSLLEAIRRPDDTPRAGGRFPPRAVSAAALPADCPPILLSAREVEVLTLIAEGRSNQEIAAELYLALNTVKRHAYNIYAKLDVRKRTHAVSKARQLGLLP